MSRGFLVLVQYGSIEYSAVSQPPGTFCSFIQRGTESSIMTPQITRVFPIATRTEPLACGATLRSKWIGRIWSGARPSGRDKAEFTGPQITQISADSKTLLKICGNLRNLRIKTLFKKTWL